jgi:hypothetical protein
VKVDDLSGAEDLTKAYEIRRAPPVEWMVSLSEYDRTSIAWRSVDDIAGHPTLEIHWQHGPEHVVDAWTLVSLIDGAPAVVWSYMPPPRYVGWTTYDVVSFQGTPLLVSQGFWRGEDGHPEELSRTFHRWNGKAFTRVDDIAPPVWLVIFGTTPTVEEAFALRDSAWCFLQAGVADSSAFPLLKPGRAVVAKAAADRATAERMLRKAKECAPDAYVKRGR